jgi:hypothetical protein
MPATAPRIGGFRGGGGLVGVGVGLKVVGAIGHGRGAATLASFGEKRRLRAHRVSIELVRTL